MTEYVPTIGLEIHAELKTKTKMFCLSKNDPDEKRPNVNVCPVCLAHPGTLPVINREAVRHVLRVGLALGGSLADYTEFDRKNYFYPDLPKGYQISQYEHPLVSGGELRGVSITRVHLEEDTASSVHTSTSLSAGDQEGATLIDFNRSGLPLMELVTEPVITSAKEAGQFARELQLLLRTLGASEANMEKGEMRVEANISMGKKGERGTKVEIKNLNSFRAMERAVAFEIERQKEVLERGETVPQETRGWDEAKQATFSQRTKEGSADYRYFPDPDLPSLKLSELPEFAPEALRRGMPELPEARRNRYLSLGVKAEDAESFVGSLRLGAFFEEVISSYGDDSARIKLAANYIANDLVGKIRLGSAADSRRVRDTGIRDTEEIAEIPISARYFRQIIDMLSEGKISSRAAKDILTESIESGLDPQKVAHERGLFQMSGERDLEATVEAVLAQNASVVADFKAGKGAALEYLVGQAMRALKGAGNPTTLRDALRREIG